MGLFNILFAEVACTTCERTSSMEIQFKYGATRQYEYKLGDTLHWGGSQYGDPSNKAVVVEGISGKCQHCGAEFMEYDISIADDKLVSIAPHDTKYDYGASRENGYFVVIEKR
jgi:hypothetical protein